MGFSNRTLEAIVIPALLKTKDIHDDLGDQGIEEVQTNQFGDTALRGDIKAEEVIIETLRTFRFPIRIISEEHGVINITDNPIYLGLLDGIDGSYVYKRERGTGRYATMFGIFSNLDPKLDDYVFSGMMEHSTGRLFKAIHGEGSGIMVNGSREKISSPTSIFMHKNIRIYIDDDWEVNRNLFSSKLESFHPRNARSSAVHYIDLATGKIDLVLECTRKQSLEIGIAYGFLKESGKVMVDLEGESLGQRRYHELAQHDFEPVISAASRKFAKELISVVK